MSKWPLVSLGVSGERRSPLELEEALGLWSSCCIRKQTLAIVFLKRCVTTQFYDMFLKVGFIKYCKLQSEMLPSRLDSTKI